MADRKSSPNTLESLIDRPLTEPPEGEDGIGPTLGEDLSAERQRESDARHHAHSEDQGPGV